VAESTVPVFNPGVNPPPEIGLVSRELDAGEIGAACDWLLDESAPVTARADFLRALHARGETAGEVALFAEALLSRAAVPAIGRRALPGPTIDLCGTGGDRAGLFNVSTAAMFVAAACGAVVLKHGNRGVTSRSGGADVLEELGVHIDLPPESFGAVVERAGCGFLFAPIYHPAFRAVAPVRRLLAECGSASVFNILGPLLNPARPDYQLTGVYAPHVQDLYARVFPLLGRRVAWAVCGEAGEGLTLDELSTFGPSRVLESRGDATIEFTVDPLALGLSAPPREQLAGGDAAHNARMIADLLSGRGTLAASELVALNAAGALVVCGLRANLGDALESALRALSDGAAGAVLERLRAATSAAG